MRTRIFFNHQTGERYELSEEDMAKRYIQNGPTVIPDISGAYPEGGILSPIDGSFITSREQLRRHNNTHGCRQAGDFKPGDIVNREKRRVDINRQLAQRGKVDFAWK
jgi:hypothetical protein